MNEAESNNEKRKFISQDQMSEFLDQCYKKVLSGIPGTKSCEDLARDYLDKYHDPELAAKKMITAQITKCTTSGFITSLGGIVTLPVAIPANVASVLYVQMRMISALAYIGGTDINSDEVQTLVYTCLAGTSITDIAKSAGVQFTNKLTVSAIKKIPGNVLAKLNRAVSFRLVTKFGSKGVINLGKLVPVVGGVVGGSFDLVTTKAIANHAYKMFVMGDII